MLRIIDAHSHINFNAYKNDAEEVIARAAERGIGMLAVGSQIDTSRRAVDYAGTHEGIWAVVGLHPTHLFPGHVEEDETSFLSRAEVFDPAAYEALVKSSVKVVGIGECGLDYYRIPEGKTVEDVRTYQLQVLRQHFDLALKMDLPVMIHCREAHDDVAALIEEYAERGTPVRGDIHCFTGTPAEAERYVAAGFYVSFTGIVTFPAKKGGANLDASILAVPADRILVETDAPYLAPIPHRGKRNEPAYVEDVAKYIAGVRGMDAEEFMAQTVENMRRLFGIG